MAAPRNTFTLKVGSNSLSAAINIKKTVERMEGVEKVEANPQQRRVVITGTVRPDKVIATLHNNLGIEAELSPSTSIRPPQPASTFTLKVGSNSLLAAINIKKTVERMEGVEKVEANPQQRRVVITGTVRPDEVIATLHNNLGIKAELELSPPTSIRPPAAAAVPRDGCEIVVGQSSNAVNPLLGDVNKVAQDVGQLRRMVPGLAGVKISNQIVSNSIEFRFNSN
ncbi:PREDICTED: heavy metal-associated isoprenylated plant protein 9-like [Ipomoea nil]|uniref:heavy metal-associated isoprenylated plant protein 9-like n=1 Tax=Ipomoea nil TaxID=35883 RepID=UPI000901F3D6|nr:PREDICTED: heavy metal-associated isoprenylated plant protein 9-like [Ipomoea nil]